MKPILAILAVVLFSIPSYAQTCRICGKPMQHPAFHNDFNYPRQINPQLQQRAFSEARILAQYSYDENQRRWNRSNGALGHPVGVPPGFIGGTGCSEKGGSGTIWTCEPKSKKVLVAEAVTRSPIDGTWYASRIWKQ